MTPITGTLFWIRATDTAQIGIFLKKFDDCFFLKCLMWLSENGFAKEKINNGHKADEVGRLEKKR